MATASILNLIEVNFDHCQKFDDVDHNGIGITNDDGERPSSRQSHDGNGNGNGNGLPQGQGQPGKGNKLDSTSLRKQLLQHIFRLAKQSSESEKDGTAASSFDLEDIQEEIASSLIQIINATFATIVNSVNNGSKQAATYNHFKLQSPLYQSSLDIMTLLCQLICTRGDGMLATVVVEHLQNFASVDMECMRGFVLEVLNMCLDNLISGDFGTRGEGLCTKVNKKWKALQEKLQMQEDHNDENDGSQSLAFLLGTNCEEEEFTWREECIASIKEIVAPRLQDKSQMVRQISIEACSTLFPHNDDNIDANDDPYGLTETELHDTVITALKWNTVHDTSSTNRSLALSSLPVIDSTVETIVSRVRDAKLKVRCDAFYILRHKIDFVRDLSVSQRIEILRVGIGNGGGVRYPATYVAATKMLCCGWMKNDCVKFEIVKLLEFLDPSGGSIGNNTGNGNSGGNEDVCISAARAIIAAASDDYQSGGLASISAGDNTAITSVVPLTTSPEITLAELSDPEVREYKQKVLKSMSIDVGNNTNNENGEGGINKNNGLSPAAIIYIRTLCDMIVTSSSLSDVRKSTLLSSIVPDVTVLGQVLQHSISKLQTIREEVDDMEVDDDVTQEALTTFEAKEDAQCFVCLHLLKLCSVNNGGNNVSNVNVVDLREEGSRRHFSSIIHHILCDSETHEGLVEGSVHALSASHEDESSFLLSVSEIIAIVVDTHEEESGSGVDGGAIGSGKKLSRSDRMEQYLRGIEIISVALEKTSRKMSSNAILRNFSSIILNAITDASLGALVREAGVSCLGRYVILMDEDIIIEKFKPLLMDIAICDNEKIEIRAQAMLAICDLAFMFERMMAPIKLGNDANVNGGVGADVDIGADDNTEAVSVSDLLQQVLSSPSTKRSLAIVAAECSTKLLFTGRIHDANIIAHLVTMYFDKDLAATENMDEDEESVQEVGSATRLQQLLTIFFPAYSMSSKISRDTLLASFKPLFAIVNEKVGIKVKGKRAVTWPIAKMVEYIIHNVETGEDSATDAAAAISGADDDNANGGDEEQESSPVLVAAIALCGYLRKELDYVSTTAYERSLFKILSKTSLDVASEDVRALRVLKNHLNELSTLVTDDTSMASLEILYDIVEEVESDDEKEEVGDDSETEISHMGEEREHEEGRKELLDSGGGSEDDDSDDETVEDMDISKGSECIDMFDKSTLDEDVDIPLFARARHSSGSKASGGRRTRKRNTASSTSRTSKETYVPFFASLGSDD